MARNRASNRDSKKSDKKLASRRKKQARALGLSPESTELLDVLEKTTSSEALASEIIFDPEHITNFAELLAALESNAAYIILRNNIIVTENILINYDVVIDFNGFSIIADEQFSGARVLDIRSGAVTLTGYGKIFAMGPRSVAVRVFGAISSSTPDYTHLTVGEGISLFAPNSYGILISPNLGVAYGLTIDFSGQIFAHDGICLTSGIHGYEDNLPLIRTDQDACIIADEQSGAAIEAAGYGRWELSGSRLTAAIGARLFSGLLNFDNTQIIAQNGAAFETGETIKRELEVTVNRGVYAAENGYIVAGTPDYIKKFTLRSGKFCGSAGIIAENLSTKVRANKPAILRDNIAEFLESLTPITISRTMPSIDTSSVSDFVPETNTAPQIIAEPKPATSAPLPKLPEGPFSEHVDEIPELADDATDEQSIMLELISDEPLVAPAPPAPAVQPIQSVSIAPPMPAQLNPTPRPDTIRPSEPALPLDEQAAARLALTDAIADIRKINVDDYDFGFDELERSIQSAERILADPLASLASICDAASNLLQAFDGLEGHDDAALSDEELDELFYHGAILEELASHKRKVAPAVKTQVEVVPAFSTSAEPDFTVLSEALATISELDLNDYTDASRESLLVVLARAQDVLTDAASTQDMVDEVAADLVAQISGLESVKHLHSLAPRIRINSPAPVVSRILPPTMIDELSPASTWSQGVTMIDELAPLTMSEAAREKMLRAARSRFSASIEVLTQPFRRFSRGLTTGIRAGLRAYHESLHSPQN